MEVEVVRRRRAGLVAPVLAGVAGAVVFTVAGLSLAGQTPGVDSWGVTGLRVAPGSAGRTAALIATEGLRAVCLAAAGLGLGWLWTREGHRGRLAVLAGFGWLLLLVSTPELLKRVFGRTHPTDPGDVSYPSTHVAMATVGAVIAVVVLGRLAPHRRTAVVVGAVVAVAGTAATRVLLGQHFLTDVTFTALGYGGVTLLGIGLLLRAGSPAPG